MALKGLWLLFERNVGIERTPVPWKLRFLVRFGPWENGGMGGGRGEPSARGWGPWTRGGMSSPRLSSSVLPASPPHAPCGLGPHSLPRGQRVLRRMLHALSLNRTRRKPPRWTHLPSQGWSEAWLVVGALPSAGPPGAARSCGQGDPRGRFRRGPSTLLSVRGSPDAPERGGSLRLAVFLDVRGKTANNPI